LLAEPNPGECHRLSVQHPGAWWLDGVAIGVPLLDRPSRRADARTDVGDRRHLG